MTDDIVEFSSADFHAADTSDMAVIVRGTPTNWKWTFAGPGHAQTIAQNNRLARERLHRNRLQEQAQVNGRKWTSEERTPEQNRADNIAWVVERLVGWSPVKIDGALLPFSPEAATKLLADPKNSELFAQAVEFLNSEASFTGRSATA